MLLKLEEILSNILEKSTPSPRVHALLFDSRANVRLKTFVHRGCVRGFGYETFLKQFPRFTYGHDCRDKADTIVEGIPQPLLRRNTILKLQIVFRAESWPQSKITWDTMVQSYNVFKTCIYHYTMLVYNMS